MERTFSIIKPDAMSAGNAGKILAQLEKEGFRIVGMRMLKMSRDDAEGFYAEHHGKKFFDGLVQFMTEGPVIVMALEREDAITKLREVMGKTNPADAADGTIRKLYAANIERNSIHGSDSPGSAARELGYFFSTTELAK